MAAGYDIIIIPGQSNSCTRGLGSFNQFGADPAMDSRIFQLQRGGLADKAVLPATEPLHDWTRYPGHGYGLVLGRLYAKKRLAQGRDVMLITAARSGTSILEWTGTVGYTFLFPDMVDRINMVLALPGEHRVVGWFENQCEADIKIARDAGSEWYSLMPNADAYYAKKLELIDAFRALNLPAMHQPAPMYFGMPTEPWLKGDATKNAFVAAIENAAAARDGCYAVATNGFETNDVVDPTESHMHFSALGQGKLAYAYFEKLMARN